MDKNKKRIFFLDELRGFAIIAMIIHHTFLDIGEVYSANWGYEIFEKLCTVQPIFWAIFIIISGICSRLSRNTIKRGIIVLGAGLIVTIITVFIMPLMGMAGMEIFFGILSCLGCCMIITGLIMPLINKSNEKVGMIVSAFLFMLTYKISDKTLCFGLIHLPDALYKTNYLMPLGFYNSEFYSADYFAIFPWIFLFIFGAFVGKYAIDNKFPKWTYKKHSKMLAFIGKNSLWVYIAHQPIIYAILYLIFGISLLLMK